MIKKILFILPVVALLTACASTPEWKKNITPESKYKINSVTTQTISKCPAPNFMTREEISKEFEKDVKKIFCEKKACTDTIDSNTIVMDINLDYTRTFMGELVSCTESYGASNISYSFDLKKDGEVFYSKSTTGPFTVDRGFIGNLGRIATQLSFTGGPDKEKADLEYMTPGIAKEILKNLD